MPLSDEQGRALLVLLEAPSKQAVDSFFCSCFRERRAVGAPDQARVAEIVEGLGLSSPLAAAPLQQAALALIGQVLYVDASAEQAAALFPPDFHTSLQALLTKVRLALALQKREPHRAPAHPSTRAPAHPQRTRTLARATAPYALRWCSFTRTSGAPRASRAEASRRCRS